MYFRTLIFVHSSPEKNAFTFIIAIPSAFYVDYQLVGEKMQASGHVFVALDHVRWHLSVSPGLSVFLQCQICWEEKTCFSWIRCPNVHVPPKLTFIVIGSDRDAKLDFYGFWAISQSNCQLFRSLLVISNLASPPP